MPEHFCSQIRSFGVRQQRLLGGDFINFNALRTSEVLAEPTARGYDYYWLACMPDQSRDALSLAEAFSLTASTKVCRFKANIIQDNDEHGAFPVETQLEEVLQQHGNNFQCNRFSSFEDEQPEVQLGLSFITDVNCYLNDQQWREVLKGSDLY